MILANCTCSLQEPALALLDLNLTMQVFGRLAVERLAMTIMDDFESLPDVHDGFTRKERAVLYCLQKTQQELNGRNVPTIMLYGRVLELVDISEDEFQSILSRFTGMTKK